MSISLLRPRWFARLALPTGLPWLSALREFFAYHGMWAPGVRLLRLLSIRGKISLVLGIMAAPVAPVIWNLAASQHDTVVETTGRLAGVRMAAAAYSLASEFNQAWVALERGQPMPPADTEQQLARLATTYEEALLAGLPVQQAWERHHGAIERARNLPQATPEMRLELLQPALRSAVELHRVAASVAAVAATSDQGLGARADLALQQLPDLQVELSRVRAQMVRAAGAQARPGTPEHLALSMETAAALARVGFMAQLVDSRAAAAVSGPVPEHLLPAVHAYVAAVKEQLLAAPAGFDDSALRVGYTTARQEAQALRQRLLGEVETALATRQARATQLRNWVYGALAFSIALSSYLLYTFFLVMRGGLVQLNHQMNRMAQGDLSARLNPLGVDEVAATMKAMTTSLVRLSDLLASVRNGVGAVTQAAQQVALGNADLSSRNHDTAHHIAAVVDGVARYAAQLEACGRQVENVVGTVQKLRLESARNRRQMQRLRERMSSLRTKSREIGEIVTLIDNIAFRTNILALNASVEASKAGESGRGFAVVAQEVRSLALRGAESARRIGAIVNRSAEDIELSGALAEETGKALAEADQHVDHIHHAMDDVAGLTRSGEAESAAILQQLTQIKDATAQSLGLVGQLATASDSLRTQGERLAHKVAQFRLS